MIPIETLDIGSLKTDILTVKKFLAEAGHIDMIWEFFFAIIQNLKRKKTMLIRLLFC